MYLLGEPITFIVRYCSFLFLVIFLVVESALSDVNLATLTFFSFIWNLFPPFYLTLRLVFGLHFSYNWWVEYLFVYLKTVFTSLCELPNSYCLFFFQIFHRLFFPFLNRVLHMRKISFLAVTYITNIFSQFASCILTLTLSILFPC